jgi:hypothetical protein
VLCVAVCFDWWGIRAIQVSSNVFAGSRLQEECLDLLENNYDNICRNSEGLLQDFFQREPHAAVGLMNLCFKRRRLTLS